VGGVTIPERHQSKGDEHLRVFGKKMAQGCSFFVSQGVYDVNASKNFLSEYYYYGLKNNIPLVPVIFALTPCGSIKTLQFMKWLGISVSKWLENELYTRTIFWSSLLISQNKAGVSSNNLRMTKVFLSAATLKVSPFARPK